MSKLNYMDLYLMTPQKRKSLHDEFDFKEEVYYEDMYVAGKQTDVKVSSQKPCAKSNLKYGKKGIVSGYESKRIAFLIIPLVLCLIIILIAGLSIANITLNNALSLYQYQNGEEKDGIGMLDPLFSFLQGEEGTLPTKFASYAVKGEGVANKIADVALPVAIALYVLLFVVMTIISIVGLAGKKSANETYKKVKFGFLSILAFLCALIMYIGGLYAVGGTKDSLLGFFTGANALMAGVGFYIALIVPVLTFICSCVAYGKKRNG